MYSEIIYVLIILLTVIVAENVYFVYKYIRLEHDMKQYEIQVLEILKKYNLHIDKFHNSKRGNGYE